MQYTQRKTKKICLLGFECTSIQYDTLQDVRMTYTTVVTRKTSTEMNPTHDLIKKHNDKGRFTYHWDIEIVG